MEKIIFAVEFSSSSNAGFLRVMYTVPVPILVPGEFLNYVWLQLLFWFVRWVHDVFEDHFPLPNVLEIVFLFPRFLCTVTKEIWLQVCFFSLSLSLSLSLWRCTILVEIEMRKECLLVRPTFLVRNLKTVIIFEQVIKQCNSAIKTLLIIEKTFNGRTSILVDVVDPRI